MSVCSQIGTQSSRRYRCTVEKENLVQKMMMKNIWDIISGCFVLPTIILHKQLGLPHCNGLAIENVQQKPSSWHRSSTSTFSHEDKLREWGTHISTPTPTFPCTFESVADAAFECISCTLYNSGPKLDPNRASNAMSKSILHYRPVKHPTRDAGRIGIEVDGARYLMEKDLKREKKKPQMEHKELWWEHRDCYEDASRGVHVSKKLESHALHRLALILAQKLSRRPWDFAPEKSGHTSSSLSSLSAGGSGRKSMQRAENSATRPVVVYFNTLDLTLRASRELRMLKEREMAKSSISLFSSSAYDNVRICCLGQDSIPVELIRSTSTKSSPKTKAAAASPTTPRDEDMFEGGYSRNATRNKRQRTKNRRNNLLNGAVDPTKGIILVVQPTEYGKEPSPIQESSLEALQRLAVSSSVWGLPLIILSPRLSYGRGSGVGSVLSGGLDASGYEHSATYGGNEPAQPTPWLLRDFTPPAFVWVGCAAKAGNRRSIGGRDRVRQGELKAAAATKRLASSLKSPPSSFFSSRIALSQSVMDVGHAWHIFAAKEEFNQNGNKKKGTFVGQGVDASLPYQYLASTVASSGRPSQDIIDTIRCVLDSLEDK